MRTCRSLLMAVLTLAPLTAMAGESPETSSEEGAIRATVEAYVKAFNRQDAKAVAALWSPDAVYTSRTTGEQVVGREAIEKEFVALFEQSKDAKMDVSVQSIQFVSPNVAVEHGTARMLHPDQEPAPSNYTAVYVRRDGQWLLDRVTDEEVPVIASHYEHLKDLEWMIGQWVDQDEDATVVTECQWTRNNNFLTRSFTVSIADRVDMAGMQIIGWDPSSQQIRSWVFDSDGGFSEGVWTRKGDRWFVRKTGVLADGRKASAVNIIKYVDNDTFTLQSVARTVGGEILPNVDEVTIVRK